MGNASQAHKLDVHGYNSLGDRKAIAEVRQQHGTDTVPAKIQVKGLWGTGDTITVTTNIGASDVESAYTPSGNETAAAAATGLAAVINGKTDHTASAAAGVVYVTKTTSGDVDVVGYVFA